MRIASPYGTILRKGKDVEFTRIATQLLHIANKHDAMAGIVIGWPIDLQGKEGPVCEKIDLFGRRLESFTHLPIIYWDERFSTQIARQDLLLATHSRNRKKRPMIVDSNAATIILLDFLQNVESYLNSTSSN
jgi:putative Holliday junction resolvase